jgi:hypothetical protein
LAFRIGHFASAAICELRWYWNTPPDDRAASSNGGLVSGRAAAPCDNSFKILILKQYCLAVPTLQARDSGRLSLSDEERSASCERGQGSFF